MQAPSNMSTDGTADESVIAGLVQQLSDMHKSQRAASQLGGLLRSAPLASQMVLPTAWVGLRKTQRMKRWKESNSFVRIASRAS